MNDYDESIVEKLPTIGKSLSFKTARNGGDSDWEKKRDMITDHAKRIKMRKNEMYNAEKIKITAWNIIKHPKSSDKQKAVARICLEKYELGKLDAKTSMIIYGISRSLNLK